MILVKPSISIAAKYDLKYCLFDNVSQQVVAYFYDVELANIVSWELNFNWGFDTHSVKCLSKSQGDSHEL